jgi:uncharacterized protein YndB with AHSA1/START domain
MAKTIFTIKREELKIVMERLFDAPRELVWKAFTDPASIPQWWGPGILTTTVDKMDVRPGGLWRYIQRDPEGNEYAFNGKYLEVTRPERLSFTFEFEPMAGHVLVQTVTLEEHEGKTKVTSTAVYDTLEDLDGMVNTGMEAGATESWDRLAELVEKA